MTQTHALLLTLAIEGVVGVLLVRAWWGWRGASLGRAALVVLAASLITHPLAWTANRQWLVSLPFPVRAAIIEGLVVIAEAVILSLALARVSDERASWWRCGVVALVMNAASFGYGLLRLL